MTSLDSDRIITRTDHRIHRQTTASSLTIDTATTAPLPARPMTQLTHRFGS